MRVATHPGKFHADEAFALGVLALIDDELHIVRTRNEKVLVACDLRVDVGFRHDATTGDFDHHQQGGAGERRNGVRYASFGLIWSYYGADLCGDEAVAARVDETLVQAVDAEDNGQALTSLTTPGIQPMTVSGVIARFNPNWDDEGPHDPDERFAQAVSLAKQIIRREIAAAAARQRARALVRDVARSSPDPRLIEFDRRVHWEETIISEFPEVLFVIRPADDGWDLRAVPKEVGSFDNRRNLPSAWAGLKGDQLAHATGVPDAMFCHSNAFIAGAASRDGIAALARKALA
jgi:uncharacterized UPF0160 family protein